MAGQKGLRVLVLDHAPKIGEKIRISGGGRCNFTNRESQPRHFLSLNPSFVRSALSRFTPQDFISLVRSAGIGFHEKHRGQLFCNESAQQIIDLLLEGCARGQAKIRHPVSILKIQRSGQSWEVQTDQGVFTASNLVIATGGLPVPSIGATSFGLDLARSLGIPVTPVRPALVPLALTSEHLQPLLELSGLSQPVSIASGQAREGYGAAAFDEDLLLTHKGLSGPAALQASSYWVEGQSLVVSWLSESDWTRLEETAPGQGGRLLSSRLAEVLPERLAHALLRTGGIADQRWADLNKLGKSALRALLCEHSIRPSGTLGWKKAEVMLGGVDTRGLESKTMESREHPGLYFIGECVDVTGHLGGHNFQWAWSSGWAAAQAISERCPKP
ncbi:MAG: hypothetical protein RLY30_1631 [Pseudomonadota bacterium]